MRSNVLVGSGLVALLVAALGWAGADEVFKSGPQVGTLEKPTDVPSSFHPFNITGDRKGRHHCLVCRFGLSPTVVVFVRPPAKEDEALDPMIGKLIKALDDAMAKHQRAYLGGFAVFLSDAKGVQRQVLVEAAEKLEKDQELKHVILTLDSAKGPEEWALNPDADVTVLLYNKYRITANFAFSKKNEKPLTEKDVEAIAAAVDKMMPPPLKKK